MGNDREWESSIWTEQEEEVYQFFSFLRGLLPSFSNGLNCFLEDEGGGGDCIEKSVRMLMPEKRMCSGSYAIWAGGLLGFQ